MPREKYRLAPERSIRRLVLRGIGVQLYRHPFIAVLLLVALTVAALWQVRRVEVSTALRTALPMDAADRAAWGAVRIAALRHNPAIATVRLPRSLAPDARARAVEAMCDALGDRAYVASVYEIAPAPAAPDSPMGYGEILRRLRPRDAADLANLSDTNAALGMLYQAWGAPSNLTSAGLAAAAADPSGVLKRIAQRPRMSLRESAVCHIEATSARPGPQTAVLRINPVRSHGEVLYCLRLEKYLRRTAEALSAGATRPAAGPFDDSPADAPPEAPDLLGLAIEFSGPHIDTALVARTFAAKFAWLMGVLGVCLFLLMILAFRKVEAILFVGLPAIVGLAWTVGIVGWVHPRVNLLSAALVLLLLGLGWEFALQIYHRFLEELYSTRRYYPALATAYTEAGRGIFVATVASTLIFATMFLSHTDVLREWALVGSIGSVAMGLAAFLVLPPLASLKSMLARERVFPLETYDFGLKQFSAMVVSSPRTVLVLALILTAWLTGFAREMKANREIGLDLGAASIASRGSDPTLSILVEGDSLQEALIYNDQVYTNLASMPEGLRPRAARSFSSELLSPANQRTVRRILESIDLREVEPALQMLARRLVLPPDAFAPAAATLDGLRRAARQEPLATVATADEALVQLAQTRIGVAGARHYVRTSVLPRRGTTASRPRFSAFRRFASSRVPLDALRFDSETLQNRRLAYEVIYTLALSVLLSGAVLLAVVTPHFRGRLGDTLLALLPLACSAVWTFGALTALGRRIGLTTLLAFPLVSGIVVCQAILLLQRLYDRRYATLRQVVRQGGRPGIISGIGLLLGLGCLNPLPFTALEEMTTAALVAIAFAVAGTLIFMPAFIQIRLQGGLAVWSDDLAADSIHRDGPRISSPGSPGEESEED